VGTFSTELPAGCEAERAGSCLGRPEQEEAVPRVFAVPDGAGERPVCCPAASGTGFRVEERPQRWQGHGEGQKLVETWSSRGVLLKSILAYCRLALGAFSIAVM